jgi:hypothetical protein
VHLKEIDFPEEILKRFKDPAYNSAYLFDILSKLESLGLAFYGTDSPDIRAKHPLNGIVFITIWLDRDGIRIEIRLDSLPVDVLCKEMGATRKLKHYDRGKKPIWLIEKILNKENIDDISFIVESVIKSSPAWG